MQVTVIRIYRQFELFQQYQQRLTALVGAPQATRLVNGALYLMTLGGNDFVNNYFLAPISQRSRQYSVPEFSRYLITEFRKILLVKSLKFMNFNNINPHMYKRNLTVDTLWHAYINGQESPIRTWAGVIYHPSYYVPHGKIFMLTHCGLNVHQQFAWVTIAYLGI